MIQVTVTRDGTLTNGPANWLDQAAAEAWVAGCEGELAFGELGTYTVTYTDLDQDATYIATMKNALIFRVNKEVDKIVGNMYSISEMILYSMTESVLPDSFLELKGTIQAAYADADPVIRAINECTTSSELEGMKGITFSILGEPACL